MAFGKFVLRTLKTFIIDVESSDLFDTMTCKADCNGEADCTSSTCYEGDSRRIEDELV